MRFRRQELSACPGQPNLAVGQADFHAYLPDGEVKIIFGQPVLTLYLPDRQVLQKVNVEPCKNKLAVHPPSFQASQIEDYFSAAAGGDNKTSDRTLARLGGRGLEAGQVEAALAEVQPAPYRGLVLQRRAAIAKQRFPAWMYAMWWVLLHCYTGGEQK
jgi:hypothetical protein